MASASGSIPDTSLGLSNEEIQILRRAQMEATAGSSSSRAASRASSQGLLRIDSSSLAAMSRHFDRLMQNISQRLEYLDQQTNMVAQQQYDRAGNAIDVADAEIARLNEIMHQQDMLEEEFDSIARLKDIVKQFRARIEEVERRADEAGSSRRDGGHRHRHSHSKSHRR